MSRRDKERAEEVGKDKGGNEKLVYILVAVGIVAFITLFYFMSQKPEEAEHVHEAAPHVEDPVLNSLIERFQSNPEDMETVKALGDKYYDGGDFAMAEMFYKKFLESDPHNTDVLVDLATAYFYSGRGEEAVQIYEQVLQFDPEHKNAMFNLGVVMDALGDREGALVWWRKFLEISGDDPHSEPIRKMIEEMEKEQEVQ